MTKGTASKGKKGKGRQHYRCRRCGRSAYHKKKSICSNCGYGNSSKIRKYSWQKKHYTRRLSSVKRHNIKVK